jgi:hypothetical protein
MGASSDNCDGLITKLGFFVERLLYCRPPVLTDGRQLEIPANDN